MSFASFLCRFSEGACEKKPRLYHDVGAAVRLAQGEASAVHDVPCLEPVIVKRGPRQDVRQSGLHDMDGKERSLWLKKAKLRMLLGDRKSTKASIRSGLACWFAFIGANCMNVIVSHDHESVVVRRCVS